MADLIQITTPAAPKDYNLNHNQMNRGQAQQHSSTGQVFDLGNQTQIVKTNERSGEQAQQNLKDDTGSTGLSGASLAALKDPSSALHAARELISRETIEIVKESGDPELLQKLTEFADEVVLRPENLAADMASQQGTATIYGDKLWSVLKGLMGTSDSSAFNGAVTDFARAAASASSADEILSSLSANFKYLSTELAPSKAVSEELAKASEALSGPDAARNFEALKETLIKLVGYTEKSLLLSDETKNYLPLIIHTMSRYNGDSSILKGSFDAVLKLSDNLNVSPEMLAKLAEGAGVKANDLSELLTKLFDKYILSNDKLSPEEKQSNLMDADTAGQNAKLTSMTNLLAAGAKHMAERIDGDVLTRVLSSVDMEGGADSVRKMIGSVIPNTPAMREALNMIMDEFERTHDLDQLVDKLSTIINNITDGDKQVQLAQGLNTVLNNMAGDPTNTVTQPNSMDVFTDFLTKNMNNSILQNLSGMNSGDMVQTLLTAPGVFNPLIHQLVPLDAFGIRAFGEMWIDPNDTEVSKRVGRKRGGGEEGGGSHVFLCFDIEQEGYFELEIYEKDKELSVMLLCPDGKSDSYEAMGKLIPKIASQSGYRVSDSIVGTLRSRRNLNEIFPKLSEQRSGLNVKV